jgi:hypothetical protein
MARVIVVAVPFWLHFAVQPALQALDAYLDNTEPYSDVNVFLFEHGTKSPGIATPGRSRRSQFSPQCTSAFRWT